MRYLVPQTHFCHAALLFLTVLHRQITIAAPKISSGMAKRACPFEENCAPQVKVHVGTADIERRDGDYLKGIYTKTLNKLYDGVNNNNLTTAIKHTAGNQVAATPAEPLCVECKQSQCVEGNCWFCEVSLCKGCLKPCSLCLEQFCSRCCIAIFKNGNNYNCLTCYT